MYRATEGTVIAVGIEFLDEEEQPIVPAAGYPKVRLYEQKNVLQSGVASPTTTPGTWTYSVSVPDLGLEAKTELRVVWVIRDAQGNLYKQSEILSAEPKNQQRLSDILVLSTKPTFDVVIPQGIDTQDVLTYQLYNANTPHFPAELDAQVSGTARRFDDKSIWTLPNPGAEPSMASQLLQFTLTRPGGGAEYINYLFWTVTPQMQLGMAHLEAMLNKSRIENTIPELQYTMSDLMTYLERGLYLFNTVSSTTAFTGTNMCGPLFDGWVWCSAYYAISAQLLAEGSLSFDFSGQGVSLNVDRTPALDSAIGRVESYINDKLVPMKKQIVKQGMTSGDGSVGKTSMRNSSNFGRLGLTNMPTTRLPMGTGIFVGRRG